jgi:hypothetical protein
MDTAKIRLSPEEEALINRADWILTKNNVLGKVTHLLSELQSKQVLALQGIPGISQEIVSSSPKISKGENYKGLPWLILDYPRLFTKESFFAIRTLFWWGNFFSTTLHVSGNYKDAYMQKIVGSFAHLREKKFCVCINKDEWQHHFEKDNYRCVEELSLSEFEAIAHRSSFIKLAKKISLEEWNDADKKMVEMFIQLIEILKD